MPPRRVPGGDILDLPGHVLKAVSMVNVGPWVSLELPDILDAPQGDSTCAKWWDAPARHHTPHSSTSSRARASPAPPPSQAANRSRGSAVGAAPTLVMSMSKYARGVLGAHFSRSSRSIGRV